MMPREWIMDTARRVFRSYGFRPIDTPALEYLEILLGKGGDETDKQLYRFQDHGGRDVGMRFDLTVPLARFVAQHIGELGTPFKRYHIATVWRGENTQRGRYPRIHAMRFRHDRHDELAADIEMVLVINDLLRALGFERFTIRVNNRLRAQRPARKAGLGRTPRRTCCALSTNSPRSAPKASLKKSARTGASSDQANKVVEPGSLRAPTTQILTQLRPLVAGNERGQARRRSVV